MLVPVKPRANTCSVVHVSLGEAGGVFALLLRILRKGYLEIVYKE